MTTTLVVPSSAQEQREKVGLKEALRLRALIPCRKEHNPSSDETREGRKEDDDARDEVKKMKKETVDLPRMNSFSLFPLFIQLS